MMQFTLPTIAQFMGKFRATRAKTMPRNDAPHGKQLRLKLYLRKLYKRGTGFIWTRPDGRQFFCKTMRKLVAQIMDYDGHLLNGVLRLA